MVSRVPSKARPQLTPDLVVAAAAQVLEREGFEGLTMRAVAAQLQVQAPALYWHFPNKDALQVALYDHLMADLVFELQGRDWREDIFDMAQQLRRHLLARRDVALLLPHGFFVGPNIMGHAEKILAILMRAGLAPRDAGYAMSTGFSYVITWVIGEADLVARRATGHDGNDELAQAMVATGAYPHFAQVIGSFEAGGDVDGQFAFGMNCLIAGFAQLIPER
ncbi:MAG: TetR/AcrR family transcriptional regulator [Phenylobacterium sp.]|uniref:TetR/AcrR family transcriptional regulator n=1 Tax=Phenylobacterium sp. TaxID=1871053 RepID=UPI00271AA411|nr:TetR/AcrR family transcriptional regulator [Phenylobacterium sp.]MDO8913312.1 TetR/AcrR family transcriptional regulator [Phenylobacterium sp.]MDP2011068.1 TetR/AcrR family transcriptional regulator [Phenylobacterium sp.]MDP3102548.1 TetR/AcrR family transcriptional regulator [Phenylobacterium sp.]MDP3633639.1 TetR/AcrR family transcriptional regulator [Phenylobacterium sp.]MDP3870146.1 TetR/AcrR family transcriptional regulator [Phenylobacterium sp.]